MTDSIVRALGLSGVVFFVACMSSTSPSPEEKAAAGTYQLQTVRGSSLPVPLFGQCSLGGLQPCAVCSADARSGTLTLETGKKGDGYKMSVVAKGVCVPPGGGGGSPTQDIASATEGSWSLSGNTITFQSPNIPSFSSGTLSGSQITVSFSWPSPDPGGVPAQVTAVFGK